MTSDQNSQRWREEAERIVRDSDLLRGDAVSIAEHADVDKHEADQIQALCARVSKSTIEECLAIAKECAGPDKSSKAYEMIQNLLK